MRRPDGAELVASPSRAATATARRVRDASTASRARTACYEALLADPDVDAVYIPLPNALHVPWSIARAGGRQARAVREAADAPRRREVERAFDVAERAGRVLMEAFMWRYHPQTRRLARLVRDGAIGRAAARARGVLASR